MLRSMPAASKPPPAAGMGSLAWTSTPPLTDGVSEVPAEAVLPGWTIDVRAGDTITLS